MKLFNIYRNVALMGVMLLQVYLKLECGQES